MMCSGMAAEILVKSRKMPPNFYSLWKSLFALEVEVGELDRIVFGRSTVLISLHVCVLFVAICFFAGSYRAHVPAFFCFVTSLAKHLMSVFCKCMLISLQMSHQGNLLCVI